MALSVILRDPPRLYPCLSSLRPWMAALPRFQLAADGFSLFFSIFLVGAFVVDAWPTAEFVKAKSYRANKDEAKLRGNMRLACMAIATVFAFLWLAYSERVRALLEDSGYARLVSVAIDPILLIDRPNAPAWLLLGMVNHARSLPQSTCHVAHSLSLIRPCEPVATLTMDAPDGTDPRLPR